MCLLFYIVWQVYGNNVEIQAISEMYNRPIHIYSYSTGADLSMMDMDSKFVKMTAIYIIQPFY